MRIAVIGTGNIGRTLGARWQQAGHDVIYGSRQPADDLAGAPVVEVGEAIADADVVLVAVPGKAVADLVRAHAAELAGTVVIDAANRMGEAVRNSHDAIATGAPTARYVRAFNTLGWEHFAEPLAGADLFFAADTEARAVAEQLIADIGLRPVYVGGAEAADTVDGLLLLWVALVRQRDGDRRFAFRIIE